MSWIKMNVDLHKSEEIIKMKRLLKLDADTIVGKLHRFWGWADSKTIDGVVNGIVSDDIDDELNCPGFAKALEAVGWNIFDDENEKLTFVRFKKNNGNSAKSRALKNNRQAKWRDKSSTQKQDFDTGASTDQTQIDKNVDGDVDANESCTVSTTTPQERLPEKEKEKERELLSFPEAKASKKASSSPPTPHGVVAAAAFSGKLSPKVEEILGKIVALRIAEGDANEKPVKNPLKLRIKLENEYRDNPEKELLGWANELAEFEKNEAKFRAKQEAQERALKAVETNARLANLAESQRKKCLKIFDKLPDDERNEIWKLADQIERRTNSNPRKMEIHFRVARIIEEDGYLERYANEVTA